ncbi:DNA polymerase [Paraconexibacter sp. AEG42_29]|uniref:DNA polymerase n=1 Tax=Paraconexibacter sp. AEG42_29 TaxID=2997339 RepID=A0AAU7APK0_9ACTN
MPVPPLSIAQVTPHAWESGHELNALIGRTATELAARGHQVLIVAPSTSLRLVRESRAAIRGGGDLWAEATDGVRVLAVGEVVPAPVSAQRRSPLPIDVTRTIEELMTTAPLDLCHVHEPFAPSTASAALRHSRALNIGTFHQPTERIVATQVARKLVDLVFGRLDARLASFQATADLLKRHFPGSYEVLRPGADVTAEAPRARTEGEPVRVAFIDGEERGALRLFLRALRHVDAALAFEVTVLSERGPSSTPLRADLRARVRFVERGGRDGVSEADVLAAADVCVFASDGAAPSPAGVQRAIAAGAVPLCSSLAVYEEVTGEGEHGLLFATAEPQTCAAQLSRLIADPALLTRLRAAGDDVRAGLDWGHMADRLEAVYARAVARRHDPAGDPVIRARLATRKTIDVDLHMHTDHSGDCATPVEVLLATAAEQGLGAIAVTDHNEVSGAFDAQAKAAEYGVKIIIGEEVKTASQGEVIGLFLTEKIPRGLTLQETVAEIKRQGGLVYVPHPFDRMHAVPDYEHLLDIVEDIDAIEIYNPRVAIGSFNDEAERFAAKYRIVAGAGSDSHVAQGLGSVRIRMPDFDGPEEFIQALAMAEIQTKPSSLLYVQALKFLETKATPAGAKQARKARRVARAKGQARG